MDNNSQAGILRIYVGSTDQINQQPLYEYLVFKAKKKGIAGATVTKGIMGYGASSIIHSYKFWEISEKVPLVVEFIDDEQKLKEFFGEIKPDLDTMKYGCLVIFSKTENLLYRSGTKRMFDF